MFRGRIAEDFKLSTGTFVRVGAVRTALLSAAPLLADAVITGEDRASVCALAWLNAAEAAKLLGEEPRARASWSPTRPSARTRPGAGRPQRRRGLCGPDRAAAGAGPPGRP